MAQKCKGHDNELEQNLVAMETFSHVITQISQAG